MNGMRAAALVAALFAISLATLQPLAHTVALRLVGPEAAAKLWGAICAPSGKTSGETGGETGEAGTPAPSKAKFHECCFGLAHAPVLALPSGASMPVGQVTLAEAIPVDRDRPTTGAIRDGPNQPRAPPLS